MFGHPQGVRNPANIHLPGDQAGEGTEAEESPFYGELRAKGRGEQQRRARTEHMGYTLHRGHDSHLPWGIRGRSVPGRKRRSRSADFKGWFRTADGWWLIRRGRCDMSGGHSARHGWGFAHSVVSLGNFTANPSKSSRRFGPGGGAWESNPPSTRKLSEQPF